MKKTIAILLIAALMLLCTGAWAATINMQTTVDVNELEDCELFAAFALSDVGETELSFIAYETVIYDIVDIATMKVGDIIQTSMGEIEVKSIESNEYGELLINAQDPDSAVTLYTQPDTNGYIQSDFEYDALVARGSASVAFADSVTINCYKMAEDLGIADEGYDSVSVAPAEVKAELSKIAEKLGEIFSSYSTSVCIENGKLTEITIDYMP